MVRSVHPEILDDPAIAEEIADRSYRDILRIHRALGNLRAILGGLQADTLPVRRVLDVGCGRGAVLAEVRRRTGADVIGVDLRAPANPLGSVSVLCRDAVRDPLPQADIAISLLLAHHLAECELIELIRNVGRSCRRFLLLDLVRHPLPLWLYRLFVTPFVSPVTRRDGAQSVRRAFTPAELRALAETALAGSGARFEHTVAPLYVRQMLDIRYR